MSQIEEKLHALGHTLPAPPSGAGNYLPFRRAGDLLFLSGAISVKADGTLITGKAGAGKTLEEAQEAARVCALNLLAVIKAAGSLDAVKQVVAGLRAQGYPVRAQAYTDHVVRFTASE